MIGYIGQLLRNTITCIFFVPVMQRSQVPASSHEIKSWQIFGYLLGLERLNTGSRAPLSRSEQHTRGEGKLRRIKFGSYSRPQFFVRAGIGEEGQRKSAAPVRNTCGAEWSRLISQPISLG